MVLSILRRLMSTYQVGYLIRLSENGQYPPCRPFWQARRAEPAGEVTALGTSDERDTWY